MCALKSKQDTIAQKDQEKENPKEKIKHAPSLENLNEKLEETRNVWHLNNEYIEFLPSVIKYAMLFNDEKLNDKFLVDQNRLERQYRQIKEKQERLRIQESDVIESSEIKADIEYLRKLKIYENALEIKTADYKESISSGKGKISSLKNTVNEKRERIRVLNRESVELHEQREKLKKYLYILKYGRNETNDFFQTEINHEQKQTQALQALQNQKTQDLSIVQANRDLVYYNKRNDNQRQQFHKKCNTFFDIKHILYDCFESYKKEIFKVHKKTNKHGLSDSIYFDISYSNQSSFITDSIMPPINKKNQQKNNKSIDKELNNILYATVKKMMQENSGAEDSEILIAYSKFKEFTPEQIFSLLTLRPDLQKQIFNPFEMKDKAINMMMIKARNYVNVSKHKRTMQTV